MTDHSLDPEDTRAWHELARHEELVLLLDHDAALAAPAGDDVDRALCQLLDALRHSGVSVTLASTRSESALAPLRARTPGVVWLSLDTGIELATAIRRSSSEARVLAIGGRELRRGLRDSDVAIDHQRSLLGLVLDGASAVRAFLWWLVAARSGTAEHSPPLRLIAAPIARERCARLLVVSRHAPSASGGKIALGGLASVLQRALEGIDALWLGWSGADGRSGPCIHAARPPSATFDLERGVRVGFERFCDGVLSPLLHGFPSRVHFARETWDAYRAVNARYAELALELVLPHGTVWVHDYHLLLVASALRARGHRGPVGLFLHAPFPPRDAFETLPCADPIVEAMERFDLIGFHTEQWADNFTGCAVARSTRAGTPATCPPVSVLPMGIDAEELGFEGTRAAPRADRLRMILAVDRLDFAKGIPERLLAYQRLLELHPEWLRTVSLVQLVVPPRVETAEHVQLKQRIETLVGRINGRFGEADWSPVEYLFRAHEHRAVVELYRAASIAAVTPLRDGLNLVAKEFVAAQDPEDPGVLVLSRFAGASAELSDAVLTNPYHTDGLADDLDRALRMPLDERKRRHAALAAIVAETTPHRWATAFLERLGETRLAVA